MSDRATKTIEASGEVCPEVAAVVAEMGYVNPAKLAWLQQKAERLKARSTEPQPAVLTYIRSNGEVSRSVPVDATVGERVAS